MRNILLCLAALFTLAACAEPRWAPTEMVQRATYVSNEPPSLTLFTVIRTSNGNGGHSGLLINGSQRVLFDPAGTFSHPQLPERNDVIFGMNDKMVDFYIDYHARPEWNVVEQVIPVTREVADLVMRRAQDRGAVGKAQCARSITGILAGVPGFESIGRTWYPDTLMERVRALPDVRERLITDATARKDYGVELVPPGDPRAQVAAY
ncbi:hypothetical protein [Falsirhodobacter halotolerans]|uniref:hypothetical protein n=1 Tax=Falsirhodobacter halotolerans TaxID=1146892 RepID=UPI001FD14E39|nr:hypothetical protein [Falsirhodobacter halotolerans]MCJ8140504.1 hypothetical protein [Falsirhodobacter halotolerans]